MADVTVIYRPEQKPIHRCSLPWGLRKARMHPTTIVACNGCFKQWILVRETYMDGSEKVWRERPEADYAPKPAEPTVCLLDHKHTVKCAPIPRGETETFWSM